MRAALLVAGTLLLAIVVALVVMERVIGAPRRDVELLAAFMSASGVLSLALGWLVIRWAGVRIGAVRVRLALAYGVGTLIALVNVLTTSALMFLNPHDLSLLLLLLAFSAVVSLAFGYAAAAMLTSQIGALSRAAMRLANGDLAARVDATGSDEVGRLAGAFNNMAEQLQQAFDRERALEADRRDLISAVSHDLRTPLSTTRAMVEALADGVVTEVDDVQRYLSLILKENQHLNRLIDDLFELSQIDSGALRLERVPVDIAQLVTQTVAAYHAPAAHNAVRLERLLLGDVDARRVEGDPERLQRVLRNLLDNALRHTPAGGTIQVQAGSDESHVQVTVSDSGSGVANADLERIFDRFYRGDSSRRRDDTAVAGAGLGLAIARGLIQAHRGRIWAEPSALGGVSVQIRLPL